LKKLFCFAFRISMGVTKTKTNDTTLDITTAVWPTKSDVLADEVEQGWFRRNLVRFALLLVIAGAVPLYIILQPKDCTPASTATTSTSELAQGPGTYPRAFQEMVVGAMETGCDNRQPPDFWTQDSCIDIVANNQCSWATKEPHNLCRESCGVCQNVGSYCDDKAPPTWWKQDGQSMDCQDVVQNSQCWWATQAPHNLCRETCGKCTSDQNARCFDKQPPNFWTFPAENCQQIVDNNQCYWATLEPHGLCKKSCGVCEEDENMCPTGNSGMSASQCSTGKEFGRVSVYLRKTIYAQGSNVLVQPVIRIPKGAVNVNIEAHSASGFPAPGVFSSMTHLDICIRDEAHADCATLKNPCGIGSNGGQHCSYEYDCVAGAQCGQIIGENGGTQSYNGMNIFYSGDDGEDDTQALSFEQVTIEGPTTQDLYFDISARASAKGNVTYSWEYCDSRCTGVQNGARPTPNFDDWNPDAPCVDVQPPSWMAYSTCDALKANRMCQYMSNPPRDEYCQVTCGLNCQRGWWAMHTAEHGDLKPLKWWRRMEQEESPMALLMADTTVEELAPRRRLLAETCEPKYPLWPALSIFGAAFILVAVFPTKCQVTASKRSASAEDPMTVLESSSEDDSFGGFSSKAPKRAKSKSASSETAV